MMKGMTEYLAQPQDRAPELVFLPDLSSDKPLDLSDGKDQHMKYFPLWNRDDQVQEYDGEWSYNISLGYNMPLQQLFQPLPGKPSDPNEVSRVILYDLNQDGFSDALICLGTYGDDPTMSSCSPPKAESVSMVRTVSNNLRCFIVLSGLSMIIDFEGKDT